MKPRRAYKKYYKKRNISIKKKEKTGKFCKETYRFQTLTCRYPGESTKKNKKRRKKETLENFSIKKNEINGKIYIETYHFHFPVPDELEKKMVKFLHET